MKSKTKVVVVGGGVVGVSALYHLAKKGWSDVVLVERKELTSGSTWHAAGLLPLFNMSYSVGQLHKYAVDLYKKLENETGKNVGFSVVSNIRLASTKDRMPFFGDLNSLTGKKSNNIYILGGMGAWGFVYAPFYAELLVSKIINDQLVINSKLKKLLTIERLL